MIVAEKRRTRRAESLNETVRAALIHVRDTLHAHFLAEGYRALLYDETPHDDLLVGELDLPAAEIFDDTLLSDATVAAMHTTMLRSRVSIMIDFAADAHDRQEPGAATKVLRACQILLQHEAAIEELARDAETI